MQWMRKLGLSLAAVAAAGAGLLAIAPPAGAGFCPVPPPCPDDPPACPAEDGEMIRVELDTALGTVPIGLLPEVAPDTVGNFLAYVNDGTYDGTLLHRSAPGFVVQGGGFKHDGDDYVQSPTDCPVCNEPCRSNLAGTIAMAKLGGDPNSATNQWFFNLADNSANLDDQNGGFTVFAKVLDDGMDVVNAIAQLPTVDGNFTLPTALRGVFTSLPVLSAPVEDPAGYGCFNLNVVGGLLTPDRMALEPDSDGNIIFLAPLCNDEEPVGGDPPGDPIECTDERETAIYDVEGQFFPFPTLVAPMNCNGISASRISLAARWADLDPQVTLNLVKVTQARVVPEPAMLALQLPALALVGLLARRRGRRNR